MREIKFRGRSVLTGEWIFGDLVHSVDGTTNIFPTGPLDGYDVFGMDKLAVDPATVGQFTGMVDAEGKRIYEGDIIRTKSGAVWEIAWIARYTRFAARKPRVVFAVFAFEDGTVIGNIHSTPELLT